MPVSYLDSPSSSYSLDIFYTEDNVSECLSDIDSDGIINCNDPDMDGDGVDDIFEDLDLDGYYDNNNYCSEPFIDLNNDGWCNFNEVTCDSAVCVYSCNATDPNSWTAFGNAYDPDIDGDGVYGFVVSDSIIYIDLNSDIDGDGILNDDDPDIDGDGIII